MASDGFAVGGRALRPWISLEVLLAAVVQRARYTRHQRRRSAFWLSDRVVAEQSVTGDVRSPGSVSRETKVDFTGSDAHRATYWARVGLRWP